MRLIDADELELFLKTARQGLCLDKTLRDMPTRDEMLLNFQQYVHLQKTIATETCAGCRWRGRHQKCSCCRRNRSMRDLWEEAPNE